MSDQTTHLVPTTAWGLLLFLVGGSAFAKVNDDPSYTSAAHNHLAVALFFDALVATALVAAVVVTLASLPSMVMLLRQGRARAQRDLRPLVAVPVALAVLAVTTVIVRRLGSEAGPRAAQNIVLFAGLMAATIAVGIVVTLAVMRVAVRVPEVPIVVTSRRAAMTALAVCTSAAVVSVTGWAISLAATEPGLIESDGGLLSTPTIPNVAVIVAVLAVAATLCGRSGWLALSSREAAARSSR